MRVVTVTRKKVSEATIAHNVMHHGTGALHIDNTRIWKGDVPSWALEHPGGWPANTIFVHDCECRVVGEENHKSHVASRWSTGRDLYEKVEVWECVQGCPVAYLKYQLPKAVNYFKQCVMEQDLIEYLSLMISLDDDSNLLVEMDITQVDWSKIGSSSVSGMLTESCNLEPYMTEIDRVLKPGAHLLLFSTPKEPTGHTGACTVEDYGYEIRDAILLADSKDFRYVTKPGSDEKNSGVKPYTIDMVELKATLKDVGVDLTEFNLKPGLRKMLQGGDTVDWTKLPTEMEDLVNIERVETSRTVRNDHPTVKPRKMMQEMLRGVPKDDLVIDLFIGSGTTALAALKTGHSLVGTDLSVDYLKIAYQRVTYWDNVESSWISANLVTEGFEVAVEDVEEEGETDLLEFFGQ